MSTIFTALRPDDFAWGTLTPTGVWLSAFRPLSRFFFPEVSRKWYDEQVRSADTMKTRDMFSRNTQSVVNGRGKTVGGNEAVFIKKVDREMSSDQV